VHAKRPAREIASACLTRLNSSVAKKKIDIRKTSRRSPGPDTYMPAHGGRRTLSGGERSTTGPVQSLRAQLPSPLHEYQLDVSK
jgi:hypothetical protein